MGNPCYLLCHIIPWHPTRLPSGDIVNVDVTVFLNGFHGDCSETFAVGNVDGQALTCLA